MFLFSWVRLWVCCKLMKPARKPSHLGRFLHPWDPARPWPDKTHPPSLAETGGKMLPQLGENDTHGVSDYARPKHGPTGKYALFTLDVWNIYWFAVYGCVVFEGIPPRNRGIRRSPQNEPHQYGTYSRT